MRSLVALGGALAVALLASTAQAQQPSMEELLRRLDALQRRVDELEGRRPAPAPRPAQAPAARRITPAAPQLAAPAARPGDQPTPAELTAARQAAREVARELDVTAAPSPEFSAETVTAYEDALRSDLPGIAIRIPGTDTQVRLYGFIKVSAYQDFNGRNQTNTPTVATIPLTGSAADQQGGDFGATPRFSRFGLDTRTPTRWGNLETRIEGDFGSEGGGGALVFRLRQAFAEVGTERLRVLIGQANSLWNEGLIETLIDATNLNQSFIRQAQLRVSGRLAPGLTGQVSLEAPETDYTSDAGVFFPNTRFAGAASPAFDTAPDLLGRLTWREGLAELGLRALVRNLSVRSVGTNVPGAGQNESAVGWGLAAHGRLPLKTLSPIFGEDQLVGLAYYGEGIGRYFVGNSNGQGALANIGLPGTTNGFSLDTIPTWGFMAGYRRIWATPFRSNISYAYARQDFPRYANEFAPGSGSALALNREMQQVIANLIWSPFAEIRNGVLATGWLDVGIEYVFSRRDLFGGAAAAGSAGVGHGIANRVLGAVVARF